MKVKFNFLNKKDFNIIKKDLLSNMFPWYFEDKVISEGDDDYFFTIFITVTNVIVISIENIYYLY